jgi:hypothetical protein
MPKTESCIFRRYKQGMEHVVAQLVEALRYRPEDLNPNVIEFFQFT